MKKLLFSIYIILSTTYLLKAQGTLVVTITGLANNKGICKTCLFNNATSFEDETNKKPFTCTALPIKDKKAEATFSNIPAGTYAILVFHDVNQNNKMDVNFLGIPKEGYGASKNKLPFASAPTFKDNQFTVADQANCSINIKIRNIY